MEITVIGELCNDVFVYGETKRLSPEAPVPVFNPLHTEINPGMAGNVVENLRALNKDIKINFIHQKSPITKTRYVDDKSNHMFIRVDVENDIDETDVVTYTKGCETAEEVIKQRQDATEYLKKLDTLVVQYVTKRLTTQSSAYSVAGALPQLLGVEDPQSLVDVK